jgi:hypothetical protein
LKYLLKNEVILLLRFLGYIIVSLGTILSPILIYQLTHSFFYSGVLIFIEWSLKLITYINIGYISQKIKIKNTYFLIDILRFISFSLYFISYHFQILIALLIASSLLQISNAISNTLFESFISFLWKDEKRKMMLTNLLVLDLLAGVIFIPIISFFSINSMIASVFFILAMNLGIGVFNKFFYLNNVQVKKTSVSIKKLLNYPKVLHLSLLSVTITIPIAIINLQLPLFLSNFNQELATSTLVLSIIKSIIGMIGVLSLFLFKKWNHHNIKWNILIFIMSLMILAEEKSMIFFLIFLLIVNICFYNFLIFLRNYRQNSFSDEDRIHLTGTFIAIDGLAYVFSSILTMVFSSHMKQSLWICIVACIFVMIFLVKKKEIE